MIIYLLCSYTLERGQKMALLQSWSQAPRDSIKHRMYRCLQVILRHQLARLSTTHLSSPRLLYRQSHTSHSMNALLPQHLATLLIQSTLLLGTLLTPPHHS